MVNYAADDTHLVVPIAPRMRSKAHAEGIQLPTRSRVEKNRRKTSVKEAFSKFLDDLDVDDEVDLSIDQKRERHSPRRARSADNSPAATSRPARRGVDKKRRERKPRSTDAVPDSNAGLNRFLENDQSSEGKSLAEERSLVSRKSRSRVRNRRGTANLNDGKSRAASSGRKVRGSANDTDEHPARRRRSLGPMANAGIGGRPGVASITSGLVDSTTASSKRRQNTDSDGPITAPTANDDGTAIERSKDENFLKERKSRQDEILGFAVDDRKKAEEQKKREEDSASEKQGSGRFKIKRRPSLTGLRDARKRVQEKLTRATSESPKPSSKTVTGANSPSTVRKPYVDMDDDLGDAVENRSINKPSEESSLQEQPSRQSEAIGDEDPASEKHGSGRFKIKRRPSLTGLRDARKRVQEKLTGAASSGGDTGPKARAPNSPKPAASSAVASVDAISADEPYSDSNNDLGYTVDNAPANRSEEENFLQERKSRQDEILGFGRKKEEEPATEKQETGRVRTKRRPSLTGLIDARKRVQEKIPARVPTRERKDARNVGLDDPFDKFGEEELKGDTEYDGRQLRDRSKPSLIDRVSNVVSSPETKGKVYRERTMDAPKVPIDARVTRTSWDL
eukprot:scaffold22583_cov106-Cylindrotheca_fusiformis.AAC.39